jgi:hypothetical protein
MSGYLDQYGVADAKREGTIKKIVLSTLAVLIIGGVGYLSYVFFFRTWSQERTVKEFLSTLSNKDYAGAYRMWGCTPDTPCKLYDTQKFDEDWGPKSHYANATAAKVQESDFCDTGVIVNVTFPGADPVALWVDRSTGVISFAAWPECPGRRWRFRQFFKNLFSNG